MPLRPDQEDVVNNVRNAMIAGKKQVFVQCPTGCHAKGTKILMHNGTFKNVESVSVGDKIMGDDATAREVLRLCRGKEQMYKITPIKGESFIVNQSHVLSLVKTGIHKEEIVNITVQEYLKQDSRWKHLYKLYRRPINLEYQEYPIHPWILGVLIGDGHIGTGTKLHNSQPDVYKLANAYIKKVIKVNVRIRVEKEGKKISNHYSTKRGQENPLMEILRKLGLYGCLSGNKFVPDIYKHNSKKVRLNILAGLLDTDGSVRQGGFDYISKSKQLADDVVFLCRSVGLAAYVKECVKSCQNNFSATYYRVSISGDCSIIPNRLKRKKASPRLQKKDVLRTGFSIEKINIDNFYGFSLDGNHLYMTSDFIVHHNSGKSYIAKHQIHAAHAKDKLIYYIVPRLMLQQQMADTIDLPHTLNSYQEGVRVCIFTMQTLSKIMQSLPIPDLIYVDEAHFGGKQLDDVVMFYKAHNVYAVYLSATPEDAQGTGFIHWTDTLIQGKSMRWLIDNKLLSEYEIFTSDAAMDSRTIYGDVASQWRKHAQGLRTLGFCIDRNHAMNMSAELNRLGIKCDYIDGSMKRDVQSAKINAFADREIDILLSVALVTTGFDLEQYVKRKCTVEAMLDLAKCDSLPLQLQKWGRVLRYKERAAVILDFVGNAHTHGLPCQERAWTLEGAVKRKQLEAGEPAYNARICSGCYKQYSTVRKVCPFCGTVASAEDKGVKVLQGELRKIEAQERKVDLITLKKLHGNDKGTVAWYIQNGSENAAVAAMLRQNRGKFDKDKLALFKGYEREIKNHLLTS